MGSQAAGGCCGGLDSTWSTSPNWLPAENSIARSESCGPIFAGCRAQVALTIRKCIELANRGADLTLSCALLKSRQKRLAHPPAAEILVVERTDQATCWAAGVSAFLRFCSLNRLIISRLKTGMSEGWRLLTQFWSRITSLSIQLPPALRISSSIV